MKRFPLFVTLLLSGLVLLAASGCSSDPNVEGAKLDLRNQDYDRALENVNQALESDPQNAEALKLKGDILQQKAFETQDPQQHAQLIEDMVAAYEQAVEVDPEMQGPIQESMRMAYIQEFDRGAKAFQRGKQDEQAYGEAAAYFKSAATIQPDSASAYLNQAYSLLNAGQQQEAIEPFEQAIEQGEDNPDTYRYLSELYMLSDRAEEAVTLLENAREQFPDNEDIQSQLLNAYIQAGMTDRAMERYQSAVESNPDNPSYRYNYGSLLLEAERYDEAIEQLSRAVELDPSYGDAQYNLGASYVNKAVLVSQEAQALDDSLRQNRSELSQEEASSMAQQIEELVEQRREMFENAVPPLELARETAEAAGEDTRGICQALYQAYVQTGQEENAQEIASCAGYEDQ